MPSPERVLPIPPPPDPDDLGCPAVKDGERCRLTLNHGDVEVAGIEWSGLVEDIEREKARIRAHLAIVDDRVVRWSE